MNIVFINGKFASQRTTGVQRLACSLVEALDEILADSDGRTRWVLLCPPGAAPPALNRIEIQFIGTSGAGLHVWEQFMLPLYTAGRLLLNLSGPAPLLKVHQVCMLPDAAVFDHPSAFAKIYGLWYRFLFRVLSRSVRLLLTISDFSKGRLVLALGRHAEEIKIVHCAANHIVKFTPKDEALDRLNLRGKIYFLSVGSFNPTKNLGRLIQAFSAIPSPTVRLVLVGGINGSVFAPEGLDIESDPRIVYTGAIDDGELAALYRGAHAFVFPTLYEGFGIPPLEAMQLGCPVIASNAASMEEVCGGAALYFSPTSVPELTGALETLLRDSRLRDILSERGTGRAAQFSWENSARKLLKYMSDAGLTAQYSGQRRLES